jgi:hypothetical protein
VNEVAALDVDGQLLSTSQSNAAAGIRSAQLSGGCACCSVSGDLQAALHQLAGSSSYTQLDYLVSTMQHNIVQYMYVLERYTVHSACGAVRVQYSTCTSWQAAAATHSWTAW